MTKVSLAGMDATYIQTNPNVYQLKEGNNIFIPNKVLYFEFENGKVKRISTSISDYLPSDKSQMWLILHAAVLVYCVIYFLICPVVIAIIAIWKIIGKRVSIRFSKRIYLLHLTGTFLLINNVILVVRMLVNSNRSYSEIVVHLVLNYAFTASSLVLIIFMLFKYRKMLLTRFQRIFYFLSIFSTLMFITLLIIWNFYS